MDNELQQRIEEKHKEQNALRVELNELLMQAAAMDVQDYELTGKEGNTVKLSEAFGGHDKLVLIHNMGFACNHCSLWADGFNGLFQHIESGEYEGKKAKFLFVSNDTPEEQKAGSLERGWKFDMLSSRGTTLFKDLGFVGTEEEDSWWPGVSTLVKDAGGQIRRTGKSYFGPGDYYCSMWHLFDLFPQEQGAQAEN
ncbi:DUF899 family protein [bacterium]|nr:DUF899 family protein [bacterium]